LVTASFGNEQDQDRSEERYSCLSQDTADETESTSYVSIDPKFKLKYLNNINNNSDNYYYDDIVDTSDEVTSILRTKNK
jgi:hypothetical protein